MGNEFMNFEWKSTRGNEVKLSVNKEPYRVKNGYGLFVSTLSIDNRTLIHDEKVTISKAMNNGKVFNAIEIYKKNHPDVFKFFGSKSDYITLGIMNESFDIWYKDFLIECENKKKAEDHAVKAEFDKTLSDDTLIKIVHNTSYGFSIHDKEKSNALTEICYILNGVDLGCVNEKLKGFSTEYDYGDYTITEKYEVNLNKLKEIAEDLKEIKNKSDEEKAERERQYQAAKEAIFEKAKSIGERQELSRCSEPCNDPKEECDIDWVVSYAMPDGTVKKERYHTW